MVHAGRRRETPQVGIEPRREGGRSEGPAHIVIVDRNGDALATHVTFGAPPVRGNMVRPSRAGPGRAPRSPCVDGLSMLAGSVAARLILMALAGVCGAVWPAAALDPSRRLSEYTHEAWTVDHGLPHDSVTALLQTRDGFLWMTTLDGLSRFDGVHFETFNLIRVAGLEANSASALAEAPDGSLWVGTNGGLVRYSRADGFTRPPPFAGSPPTVRTLLVDRAGGLWIGTRRGGLHRLDGDAVATWTTREGLRHEDVRSLAEDAAGALWVGTAEGLHRLVEGRVTPVRLPGDDEAPLVLALYVDRRDTLWIGTQRGLWSLPAASRVAGSDGARAAVLTLADVEVRTIAEDDDGNLWAGLTDGIARVTDGRVDLAETASHLRRRFVRSLAVDAEGSLWIGTDGEGLRRWRDASVTMRPAGPPGTSTATVFRDSTGAIWAGGNCGGVTVWHGDGRVATYTLREGLPNDCVRSFAEARDGAVWIGTAGGLARLDQGRLTSFTTADGLSSNVVMVVTEDRRGRLWIGTNGAGVDRLEDGRFTSLSTADGLVHDDVRVIVETRDGTVWIGTAGGGISRWRDGALDRVTRAEGLSNNNVLALVEDDDGTVWIGTNGGGLNRYREGRITHVTTSHGLPSDGIFQILDDGKGSLWMGGNRGISRVSRQDLDDVAEGRRTTVRALRIGRPEGLDATGVMGGSQPAGVIDPEGRLWFPTIAGVAIVDPQAIRPNTVPPPVYIGRVIVDRSVVADGALMGIAPGAREVEIEYTALSFVAPWLMTFQYQLEGFSGQWVDAGTRRSAYFMNLRPGRYRFRVRAANSDGVWNEEGASVEFVLRPHLYQTTPFFVAVLALVAVGVFGGVRARDRRAAARQRELSQQVEQAMARIKVLSGLLPICASCKRIRDTGDEWKGLEAYIEEHSQADFTHGICPECLERLSPEDGRPV